MNTEGYNHKKLEKIGARLRRLREARGLNAAEVARHLLVAPTTYREWERGRGLIAPPFYRMSELLDISVTELLTGEKPTLHEPIAMLAEIEQMIRQLRIKLGAIT